MNSLAKLRPLLSIRARAHSTKYFAQSLLLARAFSSPVLTVDSIMKDFYARH